MKHSDRAANICSYLSMLLILGFGIASAHAETKRTCIRSSNVEFRDCRSTCNNDLSDALLICSAAGNATLEECFESCAGAKDTCLDPFRETRQDCHDACFIAYDAAATTCQSQCTGECSSDPVFLDCIFAAKVDRFACDLACRRDFLDTQTARKACRVTFRSCVKTCRES